MTIKIKLSSGKEIELTLEELQELYGMKPADARQIPYFPYPYYPICPPAPQYVPWWEYTTATQTGD